MEFCGDAAQHFPELDGKTEAKGAGEMIGKTLGHYRIGEQLGSGGMGEVYIADDISLDRKVVLKFLPDTFTGDPERMARFEHEAKLPASLNHPNIAAIYGLEQADGKRFLVLELVQGETLAQRLSRGPLPVEEALGICRQIVDGLGAAHEKGVIHRDLKPANVMIADGDNVKILDFGLAKALSADPSIADSSRSPTTTEVIACPGAILGTAAYMSPEQAKGKAVDQRADIWAFGCILYECLNGKRPFEGDTITETLASILKGEPDWQVISAVTPRQIRKLLRRCLKKNPRERIHDIADVRIAMTKWMERASLTVESPAIAIHHGRMIAAITISLLLTATVASFETWWLKPTKTQPGVYSVIDLPAGKQLTREAIGPTFTELAMAPDGKSLVFSVGPDGSQKKAMLYVRPLERLEAKPIAGTEGARMPFFSPDGQWLGFWQKGKLRKWAFGGGIPADICECPQIPMGASWGQGGKIVIGTNENGLRIVDSQSGNLKFLTTLEGAKETSHVLPWFLPGGEALLFTVKQFGWGTRSHIELYLLDSNRRQELIENGADARYIPNGNIIYMSEGTLMAVPFDVGILQKHGEARPLVAGIAQALNALYSNQNSGAGQYAISMNGSLIYGSGGVFPDSETPMTWVDRNGRTEVLAQLDKKWIASVRLSPDGRYIAYRTVGKSAEVWVYDTSLKNSRKITSNGRAMHVCWTPDGKRLTFAYSEAGNPNIFWKAVDGTGPAEPEPLVVSEYLLQPSFWSPDGDKLIFVEVNPKSKCDIWIYNKESRKKSPIFNAAYNEDYPAVSPDGLWLAYCSDETGRREVYITSMSNPSKGIPITGNGGFAPVWAPGNRTLYYWNLNWTKLMAIEILSLEPKVKAGKPQEMFTFPTSLITWVRPYDISRDGNRFLIIGRGETTPFEVTRLNLIHNWFDEIKRLVATGQR